MLSQQHCGTEFPPAPALLHLPGFTQLSLPEFPGASFSYEPSQRAFFQAMEVRALGLFIEGLAAQVSPSCPRSRLLLHAEGDKDASAAQLTLLRSLTKWCLRAVPSARPSFLELESTLTRAGYGAEYFGQLSPSI